MDGHSAVHSAWPVEESTKPIGRAEVARGGCSSACNFSVTRRIEGL